MNLFWLVLGCINESVDGSELKDYQLISGGSSVQGSDLLIEQQHYSPEKHLGTGVVDCSLHQYLLAYDTPAPNRSEMFELCEDPKGILLEILSQSTGHVRRGVLSQLGYFTDDESVYDLLLDYATADSSVWQAKSAAISGLRKKGLLDEDVGKFLHLLDEDNASVQVQTSLLLINTLSGKSVVLEKYHDGELHPAAERQISKQILNTTNK